MRPYGHAGSQLSIEGAVHLSLATSVDLKELQTFEGCTSNARLPEVVASLEGLTSGWCQEIEKVLH